MPYFILEYFAALSLRLVIVFIPFIRYLIRSSLCQTCVFTGSAKLTGGHRVYDYRCVFDMLEHAVGDSVYPFYSVFNMIKHMSNMCNFSAQSLREVIVFMPIIRYLICSSICQTWLQREACRRS